jgi:hypothetical protein
MLSPSVPRYRASTTQIHVHRPPNKAAPVNAPIAPWFHSGHNRRGVTEQRSPMRTATKLTLTIFFLLVVPSCSSTVRQPLLRIQIEDQAWYRMIQATQTNHFPEGFEWPMYPEITAFSSFRKQMGQQLESDGFDPATPVSFSWDGPWTNARLIVLSEQQSPRFKASISNTVALYISRFYSGVPMTVSGP